MTQMNADFLQKETEGTERRFTVVRAGKDPGASEILALLPPSLRSCGGTGAALRAKVMGWMGWNPRVANAPAFLPGAIVGRPFRILSLSRAREFLESPGGGETN